MVRVTGASAHPSAADLFCCRCWAKGERGARQQMKDLVRSVLTRHGSKLVEWSIVTAAMGLAARLIFLGMGDQLHGIYREVVAICRQIVLP